MQVNYSISKKSLKLLTNYFEETKIIQMEEKLLEPGLLLEVGANLFSGDEDLRKKLTLKYLQYNRMVAQKYEDSVNYSRDIVSTINLIISTLNMGILDNIGGVLRGLQAIPSPRESVSHSRKSVKSKLKKYPTSIPVSDENHSVSQGSLKKSEDNLISPNVFAIFKEKFRRAFLMHEYKLLRSCISTVLRDLSLSKFLIEGEPIHLLNTECHEFLQSFDRNEVHRPWRGKFGRLNLEFDTFHRFITSLMLKLDTCYNLVVNLPNDLPPVIPLDRVLDPQAFLINYLYMNCKEKHVRMHQAAFVVRKGSHRKQKEIMLQVSGFKMKGGSVDQKSGELREEADRELVFKFGQLQVDIGQQDDLPKAIEQVRVV
jgi:hypothetical protein